jgi:hypothetical protein
MQAYEFGCLVGFATEKTAAVKAALVEGAIVGGGLGAMSAPDGHLAEGIGRGIVRGAGTELGATIGAGAGGLAGASAGSVAGGAGGLAVGALLSALARKPIFAGAIKGMGYGGTAGVFGGAGIGGAAGLYHGGRAGYDAAGKIMGPATYKTASEKEAARGDMVNKLLSYLKNRTLLQAEVVQPAGKAITGGWQTTSGVLGAPGGVHHHFAPSTVREVTTPPVLVRDLMSKAKSLMPLSGGMPERGGGYFDNNQKDLAGVVKQLYQAKKTGVR